MLREGGAGKLAATTDDEFDDDEEEGGDDEDEAEEYASDADSAGILAEDDASEELPAAKKQSSPRAVKTTPPPAAVDDAAPQKRQIKVCCSLWPHGRPSTIYFGYPPDVKVQRTGAPPTLEALGTRKLLFRTTWERNCVKNAFALAGFKRVRDGTELQLTKGTKIDEKGLIGGVTDAIGGLLLGLVNEHDDDNKTLKRNPSIKSGFSSGGNPTDLPWCGSWTRHPSPEVYASQNRYQRVNHFPGSWALGRKDRLQRALARARKRGGSASQAFGFVPEGYNLPAELKTLESRAKTDLKTGIWIVKPPASSCGRGIRLLSSKDVAAGVLPADKRLVAQRYLEKPFTKINGRKFDLRLYALCTSIDPLVVYVHDEGLVRFSTHKYTTKNLRCRYVHLTNYSVNKKSRNFVENNDEDQEEAEDAAADDACKWTVKRLWRWLEDNGHDTTAVRERCHDVIVKTLIAAEAEMTPHQSRACGPGARPVGAAPGGKRPCFELFGFDILLDEKLKPWLIEVNISPSLMGSSALDCRVKGRLMSDVFHTVGFEPHSAAQVRRDKKLLSQQREAKSGRTLLTAATPEFFSAGGGAGLAPMTTNKPKQQDLWRRTSRPEDINLDSLSPEDWETLCHAEDELSRALQGGFVRAWPPMPARRPRHEQDSETRRDRWATSPEETKRRTDEMLPLFESLRFSDCLLCRGATTPARRLYKSCPLGIPEAFLKPSPRFSESDVKKVGTTRAQSSNSVLSLSTTASSTSSSSSASSTTAKYSPSKRAAAVAAAATSELCRLRGMGQRAISGLRPSSSSGSSFTLPPANRLSPRASGVTAAANQQRPASAQRHRSIAPPAPRPPASSRPRGTQKSTAAATFTRETAQRADRVAQRDNADSDQKYRVVPDSFFMQLDYLNLFGPDKQLPQGPPPRHSRERRNS